MPFDIPPSSAIHRAAEDAAKAAKQIADVQLREQRAANEARKRALEAEARRKATETSKGK